MYVITGATGNIGKILAEKLLAKGKKVRVIGRNLDKLKNPVDKGAEPFIGDVYDGDFVNRAFKDSIAVFCLIPPNNNSNNFRKDQQKIAKNYLSGVKNNGIKNVILLSSIGAHLRNGAGIVDGLGDMEEYFIELKDVNILNLRPTYFMENVFGQLETIKQLGIAGGPVKGDLSFPIVATKDIADIAAKNLLNLDFKGNTIEYILGARDVTYNEITKIIGEAIGKPELEYVQFSYNDAKKAMIASGFCSEDVAELMMGLSKGMNSGKVLNAHKRTKDNTTPTTIEEFARIFANIYL